jgi:hypothetical protein
VEALENLQLRERAYRESHDLHGDGSLTAGLQWDRLRAAGDHARQAILAYKEDEDEKS